MKKSNLIVIGLLAASLSTMTACRPRPQYDYQSWDQDDDDYRANSNGYFYHGIWYAMGSRGYNRTYHYNSMNRSRGLHTRGYSYGSSARARAASAARSVSRGGFGSSSHSSYGG